jgi:hypothetical protein
MEYWGISLEESDNLPLALLVSSNWSKIADLDSPVPDTPCRICFNMKYMFM